MRNNTTCQHVLSGAGTDLEQLIQQTNTRMKISDFSIPTAIPHNCSLDRFVKDIGNKVLFKTFPLSECSDFLFRSTYNSLIQQVVEFKIILYQLRRLLEQVMIARPS